LDIFQILKRYLIISLCLVLFLGVTGCNEIEETNTQKLQVDKQTQKEEVEQSQEKVTPSFAVKKYETPFLEFEYPADYEPYKTMMNLSNTIVIAYTNRNQFEKNDSRGITIVVDKYNKNVDAKTFCDNYITGVSKDSNVSIISPPTDKNGIQYFEYIVYEKTNEIDKGYTWTNGSGKIYQAMIYGDESNRNEIEKVAQVFEKSIKFKQ